MRLPSIEHHRRRFLAAGAVATGALGLLATPAGAGPATDASLVVSVAADRPTAATVLVECESRAPAPVAGVDLAGVATADRRTVLVPAASEVQFPIDRLDDGAACAVTDGGSSSRLVGAAGGVPLVDGSGHLRGVAVTVHRGTAVTAALTFSVPAAIASSGLPAAAPSTTTAGSGSAASASPQLPASDGAASAAAPLALAAARPATTVSSAALPDTSGSGTVLVLASLGILVCGVLAYTMVLFARRGDQHQLEQGSVRAGGASVPGGTPPGTGRSRAG
jgi:hypothetical protein